MRSRSISLPVLETECILREQSMDITRFLQQSLAKTASFAMLPQWIVPRNFPARLAECCIGFFKHFMELLRSHKTDDQPILSMSLHPVLHEYVKMSQSIQSNFCYCAA